MFCRRTELCKIAYQHGTDKCPQVRHPYTLAYFDMFAHQRDRIKKVVELGIGSRRHRHNLMRLFGVRSRLGASLYMWRDFFPNAEVIGADCHANCMFEDERIRTVLCDEMDPESLVRLADNVGPDVDLFIDDAIHDEETQIQTARILLPRFPKSVYVIEDVGDWKKIADAFPSHLTQVLLFPDRKFYEAVVVLRRICSGPQ